MNNIQPNENNFQKTETQKDEGFVTEVTGLISKSLLAFKDFPREKQAGFLSFADRLVLAETDKQIKGILLKIRNIFGEIARERNISEIETEFKEQWLLFVEDYPKNRESVLEFFDSCIEEYTEKPNVQQYLIGMKNAFLESEKLLIKTEAEVSK